MKVLIEEAIPLGHGVWTAKLDGEDIRRLGPCQTSLHGRGVIAVRSPVFRESDGTLELDPSDARVLAVGDSSEVIFMAEDSTGHLLTAEPGAAPSEKVDAPILAAGDEVFLNELTGDLRRLGEELLRGVRAGFPGSLRCHASATSNRKKFVETPDNFWAVVPQSKRDRSLRVTVRGRLDEFRVPKEIDLKEDWGRSYSAFKIWKVEQVPAALDVIRQASNHKPYRR